MARLKRARIALGVVAFANVALIVATWPRPPKLIEWAGLLICLSEVALAYRKDPARFHSDVDKRLAMRMILAPIVAVAVLIALAKTRVL